MMTLAATFVALVFLDSPEDLCNGHHACGGDGAIYMSTRHHEESTHWRKVDFSSIHFPDCSNGTPGPSMAACVRCGEQVAEQFGVDLGEQTNSYRLLCHEAAHVQLGDYH